MPLSVLLITDRQFLADAQTGVELAPTPRQQIYIQRLYLYMNLTKPSKCLYLSFSKTDAAGKSIRPAYLIAKLQKMFPRLQTEYPQNLPIPEQIMTVKDGLAYMAVQMREYADGYLQGDAEKHFLTLFETLTKMGEEQPELAAKVEQLTQAAFLRYRNIPLSKAVSAALYGSYLENSVSRLELFASCCYAHFVRYGLQLDEREEYTFDVSDLGNVFHSVLEQFTVSLQEQGLDWFSFTEEQGEQILKDALIDHCLRSAFQVQPRFQKTSQVLLFFQISLLILPAAFSCFLSSLPVICCHHLFVQTTRHPERTAQFQDSALLLPDSTDWPA